MEVKMGYQQTEVGIVPEDWNVVPITLATKSIFLGLTSKVDYVEHGGVPLVRASDIADGRLRFDDARTISVDQHKKLTQYRQARRGDVLVSKSGSLGVCAIVDTDIEFSIYESIIVIQPKAKLHSGFLLSLLRSDATQSRMIGGKVGSTVSHLNLGMFRDLQIPVPPTLAEQEAIAEALSDADALIEDLEQLIAKKRQVKQGTIQELLTGKRRLPGFSGEWEVKRLGEIAEIVSGGTPSTRIAEYWNGNIDWCTPTDITSTEGKYLTHTEKRITEAGLKNSSANLLPKGALLLCSRATIGEVKIATDRICTNQGFKSLICSDQVYNEYLYYVILTLRSKLLEKGIGSTFLEISKKDTASIEIKLPPVPEQTAIAEILSDMDAEIAALEGKLSKARQVKQGMMSVLLTGRIRLVES